jgi:hippurate hydrolase
MMNVTEKAASLGGDLAELRHALHREPEVGLQLPGTQQRVLGALSGLPLEITTGSTLTSVTGVLRGARPGPAVLLRGDMDALQIEEKTGVSYRSRTDEAMHACGHWWAPRTCSRRPATSWPAAWCSCSSRARRRAMARVT